MTAPTGKPPAASAIEGVEFRRVLGHLPTGVTIITAIADEDPVGMAANSVTSVSLDPPLLLFCPGKASETWPTIRSAGGFCVNVIGRDGAELTRKFSLKGVDRFAGVSWNLRAAGPALDDAVAWIDCCLEKEHPAGDHTIVVARITALAVNQEVEPLVFFRGRYGTFLLPVEAGDPDVDEA